jgi:hypothetical protein
MLAETSIFSRIVLFTYRDQSEKKADVYGRAGKIESGESKAKDVTGDGNDPACQIQRTPG